MLVNPLELYFEKEREYEQKLSYLQFCPKLPFHLQVSTDKLYISLG